MANGDRNGVVMRWAAGLIFLALLAWMGVLSGSSADHASAEEVAEGLAAVESRSVAADLAIMKAIAGSEERLTTRLERIEDLVTPRPGGR